MGNVLAATPAVDWVDTITAVFESLKALRQGMINVGCINKHRGGDRVHPCKRTGRGQHSLRPHLNPWGADAGNSDPVLHVTFELADPVWLRTEQVRT
jgi:hypothetical protein